jgi:hypothetical protein
VVPFFQVPQGQGSLDGFVFVTAAALDGAGNLWFSVGRPLLTAYDGVPAGSYSAVASLSPTGTLTSPYNPGNGIFGFLTTSEIVGENGGLSEQMAVDAFGNLWFISQNQFLVKLTGLAVPKTYQ